MAAANLNLSPGVGGAGSSKSDTISGLSPMSSDLSRVIVKGMFLELISENNDYNELSWCFWLLVMLQL